MIEQNLGNEIFLTDVRDGLSRKQKTLSCKYFYDETGSQLFEQICELDEYYLTRTELRILRDHTRSIAAQIGRNVMLVEPGSGSSIKTQILLDSLIEPVAYVPVDISEEHLWKTAGELRSRNPNIEILPVAADFTKPFSLPTSKRPYSHVALFFPGSTIGNFEPDQAAAILRNLSRLLGRNGGLLIGIDLQKDIPTIEAAYNDSLGVTAEFNLNLLTRINRELDGDFDIAKFAHRANYDRSAHRIEVSIISLEEQCVTIGDDTFHFQAKEEILTEYSHKYSIAGFVSLAEQHGFRLHKQWTDPENLFGLLHLVLDEQSDQTMHVDRESK